MKIYIYYLSIPFDEYNKFKNIINIFENRKLPFSDNEHTFDFFVSDKNTGFYGVYAYTTDKDIDKLFSKQRNKRYLKRKVHEIEPGTERFLLDTYPEYNIVPNSLLNKNKENVTVYGTDIEFDYISNDIYIDITRLVGNFMYLSYCVKDKYLESLNKLQILDLIGDYPNIPTNIKFDEVGLFINTFKLLLKS